MSITLRPYQERDVERLREVYRSGSRAPLYVAPCGAGKTVLFAHMVANAVKRGNEVAVLLHRAELLDQVAETLGDTVEHTFVAAGRDYDQHAPVKICSVQTLVNRPQRAHPDLIIIDEGHHVAARTWQAILQAYPASRRLGVTATPSRLDGKGLADFYDTLVIGPSYEELTDAGYLTPCRAWAPELVDVAGIGLQGGDFARAGLAGSASKPAITGCCIEHYQRLAGGKRTVVFDVSVDLARARAEAFRAAGFKAECIDGTLDRTIRRGLVDAFKRGDLHVITSVDLVSEGFDLPAIECAISLRPTASLVLWMQQAGRALRPSSGKEHAILLDHADNIARHGMPNQDREWSLEQNDGVVQRTPAHAGVRICLHCYAVNSPSARICGQCREPFPKKPRTVRQKKGKLKELTPEDLQRLALRRKTAFQQHSARDRGSLIALGIARGMANPQGWADHVLASRAAKGR